MYTVCYDADDESPFYTRNIFPHEYEAPKGGEPGGNSRPEFTTTLLMRSSRIKEYFLQQQQQIQLAKFFDKFMEFKSGFYFIYGHLVPNGIFKAAVRDVTFCIQVNYMEYE